MSSIIRGDSGFDSNSPRNGVVNIVQTYIDTASSQLVPLKSQTELTGFSASITPISTNSKIYVTVRWAGEISAAYWNCVFGLKRNGLPIGEPDDPSLRNHGIMPVSNGYSASDYSSTPESCMYDFMDSPASTGLLTYNATFYGDAAKTVYTNRNVTATDGTSYERMTSSITLMEILL